MSQVIMKNPGFVLERKADATYEETAIQQMLLCLLGALYDGGECELSVPIMVGSYEYANFGLMEFNDECHLYFRGLHYFEDRLERSMVQKYVRHMVMKDGSLSADFFHDVNENIDILRKGLKRAGVDTTADANTYMDMVQSVCKYYMSDIESMECLNNYLNI